MLAHPPERATSAKRAALWTFQKLDTVRRNLIQRAGRLVRPNGHLVLSMNTNPVVEEEVLHYLDALRAALNGRIYCNAGVYITNAIESLHSQVRRAVRNNGHFRAIRRPRS